MTQRIYLNWHDPPKVIQDMCPVSVTLRDKYTQYTLYFARAIRIPVSREESLNTWEYVLIYRYILVPLHKDGSFGMLEGPIKIEPEGKYRFILDPEEFANVCHIERFHQSERINVIGRHLLNTETEKSRYIDWRG